MWVAPELFDLQVVKSSLSKESIELTRFPDEDKIEAILERVFAYAFESKAIADFRKYSTDLDLLLGIWDRYLGNNRLSSLLRKNFIDPIMSKIDSGDEKEAVEICEQLDLAWCIFQHYIYGFDDFVNREFRNSVWRCGLICERLAKRLLIVTNNQDMLASRFEDQVGRLQGRLGGEHIDNLCASFRFVYGMRSTRAAHDTTVADDMVARLCIREIPKIYLLYMQVLGKLGRAIRESADLINIVDSTMTTGTTMLMGKGVGQPPDIDTVVLRVLYEDRYFKNDRGLSEVRKTLSEKGFNYPKVTVFNALERAFKKSKFLQKNKGRYIERVSPDQYFKGKSTP